MFDPFHA